MVVLVDGEKHLEAISGCVSLPRACGKPRAGSGPASCSDGLVCSDQILGWNVSRKEEGLHFGMLQCLGFHFSFVK